MDAAVLYGVRDLRIEERPEPGPVPPGHALVAIDTVGLCGSDVHYYEEGRIADWVVRDPMIIGHEASGHVVAVGDGVAHLRPGMVVAVEPGVPCGHCSLCRAGRYNLCPDVAFLATPPVDGAMTRYLLHPASFLFDTEGLPASLAWMAEPASVGVHAARRAGIHLGDRAAVLGAGAVGLLTALAVAASGGRVTVFEVDPRRVAGARALGFDADVFSHADGREFDVVFDCSGAGPALEAAPLLCRPGGTVVLVGLGSAEAMRLNGLSAAQKELTIRGVMRYANTYPAALALIARERERLERFPLTHIGLEQLPRHLADRAYRDTMKTVVDVAPPSRGPAGL